MTVSGNQVHMAALRLDQLPSFIRSNQADIVIIDSVMCGLMHEICIGAVFNWTYNHEHLAVSVALLATKTNNEVNKYLGILHFANLP